MLWERKRESAYHWKQFVRLKKRNLLWSCLPSLMRWSLQRILGCYLMFIFLFISFWWEITWMDWITEYSLCVPFGRGTRKWGGDEWYVVCNLEFGFSIIYSGIFVSIRKSFYLLEISYTYVLIGRPKIVNKWAKRLLFAFWKTKISVYIISSSKSVTTD